MDLTTLLERKRAARELAAERHADACSRGQKRRNQRHGEQAAKSFRMRQAWRRGAFAARVVGSSKATPEKLERAMRLRAAGWFFYQIAAQLDCSTYTAARWCGWKRVPRG
jgi:hypothetical protein